MINLVDVTRSVSNFDPVKSVPIHIIGVGATGSKVVTELLKAGYFADKISIYDMDVVEEHNICNQAFYHKHIGMPKVEAMQDLDTLIRGSDTSDIQAYNEKFERIDAELIEDGSIVCIFVDTMESRKDILAGLAGKDVLVVETGLGGKFIQTQFIDVSNIPAIQEHIKNLPQEEEVPESECGTKIGIGMASSTLAALTVSRILDVLSGRQVPTVTRYSLADYMG